MLLRYTLISTLLLAACGLALGQDGPPNLVENPSLEGDLAGRGLPGTWTIWSEPAQGYTTRVVTEARTGGKALCIQGSGKHSAVVTTRCRIEPGKRYLARGWVRLEGDARVAAAVKLDFMRPNGNYIDEVGTREPVSGEDGWRCLSVAAHAEDFPDAGLVALAVSLEGNGKAWFDDLELVAVDAAAPGENLLVNGSMEEDAGGRPAYWSPFAAPGGKATLGADEEEPKEGKRSLSLKGKAAWAVALGERYRTAPGKTFTLSGFVRAASGSASIKIDFYQDRQYLGSSDAPPARGKAWEERSVTGRADKYPTATHVVPTVIASGGDLDASFDQLVLTAK